MGSISSSQRNRKLFLRTNRMDILSAKRTYEKSSSAIPQKDTETEISQNCLNAEETCKVFHFQRENIYRKIWISMLFICIVICAYQISDRVNFFLLKPTATEMQILQGTALHFPSLMLCPVTFIEFHPAIKFLKSQRYPYRMATMKELLYFSDLNLTYLWKLASISETVVKAFLVNREYNSDDLKEKPQVYQNNILTYRGTCVDITLYGNSLHRYFELVIEVVTPNYFQFEMNAFAYEIIPHDKGIVSSHLPYMELGIGIMRSHKTEINIGIKKFLKLSSSGNPCISTYEAQEKWTQCLDNEMQKLISCKLPFTKNSSLVYCSEPQSFGKHLRDAHQTYSKFVNGTICQIPRRCDETVYTVSLNNKHKLEHSQKSILIIGLENNCLEVLTEYYSYNVVALLSDIGGSLGLFLGLSVFALLNRCLNWILEL